LLDSSKTNDDWDLKQLGSDYLSKEIFDEIEGFIVLKNSYEKVYDETFHDYV